jgi:zinc transport system substrate-binding protein
MKSRDLAALASLVVAAPLLTGCGGGEASGSGTSVVTSFYPLQYVAQRVAGARADVTNLTRPGQEPHDLELTVRQTAEVGDADVVLYESGFQAAVDDAVEQSDPEHVVDAAATAGLTGDDPHFWLDPTRLADVATALGDDFARRDPANAADYRANAAALVADLEALDAEFRTGLAQCRTRELVTGHAAFGYLAERYDLHQEGVAGVSPDLEPDAATLRDLSAHVRDAGVTTVYSESLVSPALAETVAREAGVRVAVLDPLEGITDASRGHDYLEVMRANLATLRAGQECS